MKRREGDRELVSDCAEHRDHEPLSLSIPDWHEVPERRQQLDTGFPLVGGGVSGQRQWV